MRYHIAKIIFQIINCTCLIGCCSNKTISSYYTFSPAAEIVYVDKTRKKLILTDSDKIKNIINLINLAKKQPAKFIALEEIIIRKWNDSTYVIRRNNEFYLIKGVTFVLTKKQNKKVNQLLQ